MSDTDSFIEEVTEELRRDQMVKTLRRYGWVVAAVLALIIGGVAWSEYQKAQERAAAEAIGDGLLGALAEADPTTRISQIEGIEAADPTAQAVVSFLKSSNQAEAGDVQAAIDTLHTVVNDNGVALIYRQVAQYKALGLMADTATVEDRRRGYGDLAIPGGPLRLLAEEQLALIDIQEGDADAAIAKLQSIVEDAESTADLQQRALQVIVALGGEPDLSAVQAPPLEN